MNDVPIQNAHHAGFLSGLRALVASVEEARNCIAHNRDLSVRAREGYDYAKPLLLKAIDDFWASEVAQ